MLVTLRVTSPGVAGLAVVRLGQVCALGVGQVVTVQWRKAVVARAGIALQMMPAPVYRPRAQRIPVPGVGHRLVDAAASAAAVGDRLANVAVHFARNTVVFVVAAFLAIGGTEAENFSWLRGNVESAIATQTRHFVVAVDQPTRATSSMSQPRSSAMACTVSAIRSSGSVT